MPNIIYNRRLNAPIVSTGTTLIASINFRGTSGYVTDGAGQTYCIGDSFPTTRGGNTFGWSISPNATDRSTGVDPRFAGINWLNALGTRDFSLTLPSAGTYNINYSVGDASGGTQGTQIIILDNASTLDTSGSLVTTGSEYYDISGTKHANHAAWIANAVPKSLTFATTSFKLRMNHVSDGAAVITHLVITQ